MARSPCGPRKEPGWSAMGGRMPGTSRWQGSAARADRVSPHFRQSAAIRGDEDLDRYPRQDEKDLKCWSGGLRLLWRPRLRQYPPGSLRRSVVKGLAIDGRGGSAGHFEASPRGGQLLCAVRPDIAIFGEKDFQQLAVIRRMAQDLQLGVEILGHPTIRDADGLALSSRNAYLSADERQHALALPQALHEAAAQIKSGTPVAGALAQARERLTAAGFSRIDYVALVNALTLEPLEQRGGPMRLSRRPSSVARGSSTTLPRPVILTSRRR